MDNDTKTSDERKMIPVSEETHRRVMAWAGRLTAERGKRTSMGYVVDIALNIAEPTAEPTAEQVAGSQAVNHASA